jgi:Terminase large subunit, T4likevirus-type, N-terminal
MGIADDLAYALDPALFAAAAGLPPDPWQVKLLRSSAPRILLNCSRQAGKSTAVGVLACHTALYHPGSLTLMVSPTQRQSGELFRKALAVYRALGRPVDAESESALQLELENGSRLVALPGREDTIRSYSGVSLLLIDEAARVKTESYMSVRPMLAVSQGRLVALSSPFGTRGWWYEAWRGNGMGPNGEGTVDAWERYRVAATDCPRISAEFLAEERRAMGSWWWDQEFMCVFRDAQDSVFRQEDIDRCFSEDYETWDLGA